VSSKRTMHRQSLHIKEAVSFDLLIGPGRGWRWSDEAKGKLE
jgi:hypothetical protein